MSLRYVKIKRKQILFKRLFGISPHQFEIIFQKVQPLWEATLKKEYKRRGRDYKLGLEDMILMLLLYFRSYITQLFIGYLWSIDDSRVCRIIKKLEPILAEVMKIQKEKHLKKEDVEFLLIDATEQPCERPQKDQKVYYSGKKKRHTLKTEIRVTLSGRIVHVSKTRPGSIHDFNLHKQEPPIHKDTRVFVDSGYQGLQSIHLQTELPYKKPKNGELKGGEKEYNKALSRIRVKAENVFAQIKTFKILSDRYRNKRKRYNLKFNIIAGIVNMKNGFMAS
jgi:hypothetical protein